MDPIMITKIITMVIFVILELLTSLCRRSSPSSPKATPEACRCDQDVTTCLKSQLVAICLFQHLHHATNHEERPRPPGRQRHGPGSDNRETRSRPPGALENHPDIANMLFPKYWRIQPRLECLPPSSGGIHCSGGARTSAKVFPQSTGAFRGRAIYFSPP